uniref:non-specific serine/threonine protein kinase n=2 Tax=Gasterosteus aculeatus aculeatus TaxID=481459 RepID=A0AAQ4S251_GASAC
MSMPTTGNMLSASDTGAESELSEPRDESTEPSSNVCECLAQERSTELDRLKPSSSSSCWSMCSQPAPKDDDFRVCRCFGSSEPAFPRLPHFSRDLISAVSESFSELRHNRNTAASSSLTQGGVTPQPFGAMSSASQGLMEPFVTEPLSSSEHSPEPYLLSSFSPQSDSLERHSATAPLPELYISESETQDFILSPHQDPREFQWPEYHQWEAGGRNADCHTHHFPMRDSDNEVTRCRLGSRREERATLDCESDARAPAAAACAEALVPVNDERPGNAQTTDLTPQPQQSPSPVELWLDACQYLAGEDTEDLNVLDKARYSVIQGGLARDSSFPPGDTKVSGYNLDDSEGIGWSSDDTICWGPPVERWSSVDSWASALSDWSGIIAAPPEDFAAAFTEIGAEIDALTQALAEVNTHLETDPPKEDKGQGPAYRAQSQPPMGLQDQHLEAQNPTESSILSGQSCRSSCPEAAGPELGDRERCQSVESLCDSTAGAQDEKEAEEIQNIRVERSAHRRSSAGSSWETVAAPGGGGAEVIPGSTPSADLNPPRFGEPDRFFNNKVVSILLNIVEDTDLEGRDTPGDLMIEKPFGDEVCEVTDNHSVSRPRWSTEREVERSRGPAEVDREGTLRFHATRASANSHVPGEHAGAGSRTNVGTRAPPDTLPDLDEGRQVEPRWASPKFIMPLAPLGISALAPHVCRTSRSLEGDQTSAKRSLNDNRDPSCDRTQACAHRPTSEGIADIKSSNGDELSHEKGTKIKYTEKSSKKGQVDLIPTCKTTTEEIHELSGRLLDLADAPADQFFVSQKKRVAFITLDLNDPFVSRAAKPIAKGTQSDLNQTKAEKMPRKTHKTTSESKARSKKDKTAGHYHGTQACKKQEALSHHVSAQQVCKQQETHPLTGENHTGENNQVGLLDMEAKLVIDAGSTTEKAPSKPHGKKKKKNTGLNGVGEPLVEVENGAKPKTAKGRIEMFEAKLGAKAVKAPKDGDHSEEKMSQQPEAKARASQGEKPQHHADHKDHQPKKFTSPPNDDIIKRRRLSEDKFGKLSKPDVSTQTKGEEPKVNTGATRRKAFGDVVKPKIPPKEDPKVVQPIQTAPVSGDPRSLCLWCQLTAASYQCTVTWSRGGAVLSESKRSAGDDSRVSLTISNASHKDLGKYQCQLTSSHGSVTLDYLLTYEVLCEIVVPPSPNTIVSAPVEDGSEEEDVHCSKLIFREDFLSNQHFGENQHASIITEKVHFGEGMHRRAFRTKMQSGQIPLFLPGHPCVLKVHNAISYGTKNNDELIQKNFSLAVEECHVQNTAREYIKGYTTAARTVEAFGEVPEIIPIYLVHRPSNDIPYATLEEELVGDFVKYSVKDGKEVNLKRRDSEAGQKCCAFQHWVYHKTEGNLLVTDMQGVGMRLTDVGIATCKKGYKGFKGNCATSFIDQFKALHQCNAFCELLGLKSLQPKPKKPVSAPKPKPQPSAAAKKKTSGPSVKGKS